MSKNGVDVIALSNDEIALSESDFADKAQEVMKNREKDFRELTTTKLRNIYSQVINVSTKVNNESEFQAHIADIQYLKVKMAYESGRERSVEQFLGKTQLMALLDNVKTYEQFTLYCKYAESLVAYFKFYGGRN